MASRRVSKGSGEGREFDARSRMGFLQELQTLQADLWTQVICADTDALSTRRFARFAARLDDLALGAQLHDYELLADELTICEAVVRTASLRAGFTEADRLRLEQSHDRIESFVVVEQDRPLTITPPPVAQVGVLG